MVRLCVYTTLVALGAEAITRHSLRMHEELFLSEKPDDDFPEMWYGEQTLDHFANSSASWSQRYFENFQHYKPGGPIFLYIGGEGPLSASGVSGRTVNAYFSQQYGGATVALEHRFYGKSQPFDNLATEHLPLLTSRQALHDLNQFSSWFAKNHSLGDSKFFCMGGSYPGSLAAWYRQEFPDATAGCWAASAPVEAKEDWPGYGEMVWRAVSTDPYGNYDESITTKLYAGYQQLAMFIQGTDAASVAEVEKQLNACPGSLAAKDSRDNWEFTLMDSGISSLMQYNATGRTHLASVRALAANASSPLEAALAVTNFLNVTQGSDGDCVDLGIDGLYQSLSNYELPESGAGNAGRTWFWQTCNEFGYFQTATAVWGKTSFYTLGANNPALWQGICERIYAISAEEVSRRVAATNAYYGAKHPKDASNIIYSNGELDAWSLLSITGEPPAGGNSVVVAPLGSHCIGLSAPAADELPGAKTVRDHAMRRFEEWGANGTGAAVLAIVV